MGFNFPNSPLVGAEYSPAGGPVYEWNGSAWTTLSSPTGGGGGGDDFDTTEVAAIGSTLGRTMPEWLAGAPVIEIPGDITILPEYRGAWLHMMNAVGSTIYLVNNWAVGMSFGARQIGTGTTQWVLGSGASQQLPFTRLAHVGIAEQYEEIIFRVVANSDGTHAVWAISGATG